MVQWVVLLAHRTHDPNAIHTAYKVAGADCLPRILILLLWACSLPFPLSPILTQIDKYKGVQVNIQYINTF